MRRQIIFSLCLASAIGVLLFHSLSAMDNCPTFMDGIQLGGVLLHTTLDDATAITSPAVGVGGTTTLLPEDFVATQVSNGAQFVGPGKVDGIIDELIIRHGAQSPVTVTPTSTPTPTSTLTQSSTGITDPDLVVTPAALLLQPVGTTFVDPVFGTTLRRVSNTSDGGGFETHIYSQLQAFSSDNAYLLLDGSDGFVVRRVSDLSLVSGLDTSEWNAPRWHPAQAHIIVHFDTNADTVVRLQFTDVDTLSTTTVFTFPTQYERVRVNQSFDELSEDGRWLGGMVSRDDGEDVIFALDIQNQTLGTLLPIPDLYAGPCAPDPVWGEVEPDWVGVSPLGNYLVVQWQRDGITRCSGLETFDLQTGAFVGRVYDGHQHGDLGVDSDGVTEFFMTFEMYHPSGNEALGVRALPGTSTVSPPTYVQELDWIGDHISCQGPHGVCLVTTYDNEIGGWSALEGELFLQYTDGSVLRLAHHRSSGCGYWVQPRASISRDGRYVVFASDWGQEMGTDSCSGGNDLGRGDPYLIDLSASLTPTVYYVAANEPGASDSNNGLHPTYQGGQDGPWLTLQHAASTMTAGDTTYVRAGTYYESGISFAHSGTPDAPITLANYQSEEVIIDGSQDTDVVPGIWIREGRGHYVIQGLTVRNMLWSGIETDGDTTEAYQDITIRDCVLHDNGWSGIELAAVDGFEVDNVEAYNNAYYGLNIIGSADGALSAKNGVVRDSSFYNHTGDEGHGLAINQGHDITVSDSVAYHNTIHGFDVSDWPKYGDLSYNIVFERNFSYDNGLSGFAINSDSHHVVYRNNIAWRNSTDWPVCEGCPGGLGSGFYCYEGCWHVEWINNTSLENAKAGFRVDGQLGDYGTPDDHLLVFKNNITYNNDPTGDWGWTAALLVESLEGDAWEVVATHNDWSVSPDHRWAVHVQGTTYRPDEINGGAFQTGNISVDPQFVNPTAPDVHLLSTSPAIDAGTNASAPTVDFDGNPRPLDGDLDGIAVADMGADEFSLWGDLDYDCDVDIADIMLVAGRWHNSVGDDNYDPIYDLDDDGDIDIVDVMLVAVHWGETC